MQRGEGSVAALCCNDVIETDRYCIFLVFFNRKILVIASFWWYMSYLIAKSLAKLSTKVMIKIEEDSALLVVKSFYPLHTFLSNSK